MCLLIQHPSQTNGKFAGVVLRTTARSNTFRTLLKKKKRHDPDMLTFQRVSLLTQGRFLFLLVKREDMAWYIGAGCGYCSLVFNLHLFILSSKN